MYYYHIIAIQHLYIHPKLKCITYSCAPLKRLSFLLANILSDLVVGMKVI